MILVNGVLNAGIDPADRGLMYGDGIFRTLLVTEGKPVCWQRHYKKLKADCEAICIECPPLEIFNGELSQIASSEPNCVLKIIVTRGVGQRGYAPIQQGTTTRILMTSPLPTYPEHYLNDGIQVHTCSLRLSHQERLAGVKHLNRLENILARMEWDNPEIAEGLLLDEAGNIVEGTMTNLFMLKNGILHSPDLTRCGVSGVTRDRIISAAPMLDVQVAIGTYSFDFMLEAEEVLVCNSVIGVWQIHTCQGKRWNPGRLAPGLRNLLSSEPCQ